MANDVTFSYAKGIFQRDIVTVSISCSSPDNLADSLKVFGYLKNKLLTLGVSDNELEIIKRNEKLAQAYQKDDVEHIANHFGWFLACGYSLKDIQISDEIISSITTSECNRVLREVFSPIPKAQLRTIPKDYNRD
jgi:predicted Zn-dependent peptidase